MDARDISWRNVETWKNVLGSPAALATLSAILLRWLLTNLVFASVASFLSALAVASALFSYARLFFAGASTEPQNAEDAAPDAKSHAGNEPDTQVEESDSNNAAGAPELSDDLGTHSGYESDRSCASAEQDEWVPASALPPQPLRERQEPVDTAVLAEAPFALSPHEAVALDAAPQSHQRSSDEDFQNGAGEGSENAVQDGAAMNTATPSQEVGGSPEESAGNPPAETSAGAQGPSSAPEMENALSRAKFAQLIDEGADSGYQGSEDERSARIGRTAARADAAVTPRSSLDTQLSDADVQAASEGRQCSLKNDHPGETPSLDSDYIQTENPKAFTVRAGEHRESPDGASVNEAAAVLREPSGPSTEASGTMESACSAEAPPTASPQPATETNKSSTEEQHEGADKPEGMLGPGLSGELQAVMSDFVAEAARLSEASDAASSSHIGADYTTMPALDDLLSSVLRQVGAGSTAPASAAAEGSVSGALLADAKTEQSDGHSVSEKVGDEYVVQNEFGGTEDRPGDPSDDQGQADATRSNLTSFAAESSAPIDTARVPAEILTAAPAPRRDVREDQSTDMESEFFDEFSPLSAAINAESSLQMLPKPVNPSTSVGERDSAAAIVSGTSAASGTSERRADLAGVESPAAPVFSSPSPRQSPSTWTDLPSSPFQSVADDAGRADDVVEGASGGRPAEVCDNLVAGC